ncbi:n-acetylglutamate synthase [Alteromonas pelagimontana]|uniref:N-acetylglutamate synthase n=1 Tax=Alteromonas pelagimontana TaxID=1858656 RepID=A0A6M4MCA3_9ALTE|nr:n-acetylglutamate synthase [Alteromonas pelagimontana]QJR80438.1 n-acetylglutamate synthase [Alteromonas pelagimontana]
MNLNLHTKVFRSVTNTGNGEVGADTIFHYQQHKDVVTATYQGGSIANGHLIAKVLPNGELDMRYHHINKAGELMLGRCLSTSELLPNGRLKFRESGQWLSGDMSSGYSEIEEI